MPLALPHRRSVAAQVLLPLAAACALCLVVIDRHQALVAQDGRRAGSGQSWALDASSWKRCALSYRSLAADLLYLRAINAFGSRQEHRRGYPSVMPLLSASSELDPSFVAPYLLAATGLAHVPGQAEAALSLLERGVQVRGDQWMLRWLYGFELSEQKRYAEASEQLAEAATSSEAPSFLAPLAARLAAEGGRPQLGLSMIDALLANTSDPTTTALLLERRAALEWQLAFDAWQAAIDAFGREHGRPPTSLAAVQAEQARLGKPRLPARDPWGAPFAWEHGRLVNDHASQRLRLHVPGLGAGGR